MTFSNLIAFFIIVTTAATLDAHGITKIETAAQAAEALRPIAGEFDLRAVRGGHHRHRLLAVPVLAGSAAYAVAEAFGLRGSLELPASRALGFYAIVGAATLGGAALAATRIDPIAMLFWTAVINGVVAVPVMIAVMLMVSNGRGSSPISALPRVAALLRMARLGADGARGSVVCAVVLTSLSAPVASHSPPSTSLLQIITLRCATDVRRSPARG